MRQYVTLFLLVFVINFATFSQCTPTVTGPQPGDSIGILKVEIYDFSGGLLFSNQSDAEEGYVDNTALPSPLLIAGDGYVLHTTINNVSSDSLYMLAKMDFNNDMLLFAAAGEVIAKHDNFPGDDTLFIDTFYVPTNVFCDTGNIRFRLAVSTDNPLLPSAFVCAFSQTNGDIEDYTISIKDTCFYCIPVASNNIIGDSIGIFNFTLGSINNTSLTDQGYEDFTSISTKLGRGMPYDFSVRVGNATHNLAAWIDYDQNKSFDFTGELISLFAFGPYIPALTTQNTNFTVPLNAPIGTSRLRVVSNNGAALALFGANCTDMQKGDIEEYTVVIVDTVALYTSQKKNGCIYANQTDKSIMNIEVSNSYPDNNRTITKFDFNTNGTTNPVSDIVNAKLWYSGVVPNNNCNASILLGTVNNPNGNFSFTINQPLLNDKNYFHLTYDLSNIATIGNKLDADLVLAVIDGNNYLPDSISPKLKYDICEKTNYPRKEANIWYPTRGIGIDFNCSPPKLLDDPSSSFANSEGSGTISDDDGDLLFYLDEPEIFNRCHELLGRLDSVSSSVKTYAIAFKDPGNPLQYYIISAYFDNPPYRGDLYYTLIDMTLNGGLGGIVPGQNTQLIMDNTFGEAFAIIQHSNKQDMWIVNGKSGINNYHAYLVTSAGIMPPVVSTVGLTYTNPTRGTIKISPNGKKMVVTMQQSSAPQLFDFDNTTGLVSNPITLTNGDRHGASFSPDNSKLYIGRNFTGQVYQYDLCNGNARTFIGTIPGGNGNWLIQNGPDGKIYLAPSGGAIGITTIDNPNSPTPTFLPNDFSLEGKTWGSPLNFISGFDESIFNQSVYSDTIFAGFDYINACADSIAFIDTTPDLPGCVVYPKTWYWNFGDTASGLSDTSTKQNPKHLYSSSGTYRVTMVIEEQSQRDTVFTDINVLLDTAYTLPSDTICIGDSVSIGIVSSLLDVTYTWNPTTNLRNPDSANTMANPSMTTTYVLMVSNSFCTDTITETVFVDTIFLNVTNDTVLCFGDTITISANSNLGNNILWSPNQFISDVNISNPEVFPDDFIKYIVTTTNTATGCFLSDSINISVINPTPYPFVDDTICGGESVLIGTSPSVAGVTYVWNPTISLVNPDSANPLATPSITTTYVLVANIGVCTDTITKFVFVDTIFLSVSNDTVLCYGDSAIISANSNLGNDLLWTPNQAISNINIFNPIIYPGVLTRYFVTATNNITGCFLTDSINVDVINPITNSLNDSFLCSDLLLDASNINASGYLWSTGETTPTITILSPDTIWVEVYEGNCIGSDTGIYAQCPNIFIPNAFSPNGDGNNDFLRLLSTGVKKVYWAVYDRWGNKVFSANGITDRWDGTYLDKPVVSGVYVYYIKGEFIDNKKIETKGNISLIR